MRRRPYIFVSICMFISSNAGISILASEFAQSIRSIHLTDPIRMTELDNSNFGLKPLENFPYPLIYPSEFSFFKLIDYGDPSFQSLDILAKFPAKDNFTGRNYHKEPLNGKNPLKFPVDDKSNLFEQVDPVIQFVQTGPVKSLSTDDELKSFLNNKNKKKSEDEKFHPIDLLFHPKYKTIRDIFIVAFGIFLLCNVFLGGFPFR